MGEAKLNRDAIQTSVSDPAVFEREQTGHVDHDLASFAILTRKKIGECQKLVVFWLSVIDDDERISLEKSRLQVYLSCIERIARTIAARIGLADVTQPIELPV